ncbi:sensor histidine kinase [Streptomyces sp. BE303]|uniref:sensor histidine kinase n=1 Tax=Streptomyces sp. BE303 TaxID=3002528 RepID=UPI002E767387|nr:histidine kinase [Streptomyces sp. BE303]MED7955157.1 histidine kinase [Streptomyces sp. BE303]
MSAPLPPPLSTSPASSPPSPSPSPGTVPPAKRVPPGVWTALAWCLSLVYPFVVVGARPHTVPSDRPGLPPELQGWTTTVLATLVAFAAAALLRRWPLLSTGLLLAATVAQTETWRSDVQLPPTALLAVDAALCLVAATRPRRTSRAVFALVLGVLVTHLGMISELGGGLLSGTGVGASDGGILVAVIAWLVGRSVRQSREHAETLSARAAAQAATAERLRIAREMHDTVAHSIGIVALQAGAARRVIDTRPDRAREALAEIEAAGRETLAGLRRMLGALRQADREDHAGTDASRGPAPHAGTGAAPGAATVTAPHAGAEPTPPHRPPGLAGLDRLTSATTAAGVRVDVHWHGERRPLPPEVDLAAFRIIQESVTNVVRHAATPSCRVSVDCRNADEVAVEITDAGLGRRNTTGSGYGLAGLRERVALLNGEFHAAPRTGGGFRVAARLPVPGGVR